MKLGIIFLRATGVPKFSFSAMHKVLCGLSTACSETSCYSTLLSFLLNGDTEVA